MRKAVVDYRNLRLSNLKSPTYRHLLLLWGWVIYFALFFLTENLIPAEKCHPIWCPVDDWIPFNEWFVIPYVGWYGLIVWSLGYFALYNVAQFKNLQKYIIITQAVAMICYIFLPSRQDLRPQEFERNNLLTQLVGLLYSLDTNTGVCPSLHVAFSLGIASTWLKEKGASNWTKTFVVVFALLVCMSVAFVKQHSVLDILAAIPVCALAEILVFGKTYWRERHKNRE